MRTDPLIPNHCRRDGHPCGYAGRQDLPRGGARRQKALRAYPGAVRDALHSRCGRGAVFHHLQPHGTGFHGVLDQKMRLRDLLAARRWSRDSRLRSADPTETASRWTPSLPGKDLLFIAGGIGLAPLHSVINYCRHYRDRYGKIDIVYGSRSHGGPGRLPGNQSHDWCKEDGINVHLTIDREQPEWDGHVGFVPNYVKELGFTTDKTVVMCGPPIMIKFTLAGSDGAGLRARAGVHDDGAANEVRARKVRPVQHRRQIRLQGRTGLPV